MTSYKSEQTYFAVHLHRILRSCPVSHYSRCGCSTDVSLHHTHTIPISLFTYFMVARELTKHCFHRILRCLCSFAVDAQLLNRCLASTYKYYPKGFHSAHAAVAKPTFMHQAPLRRLQTTSYHTKIQISRLRDILQGRYTTDPCHYCIVSVAAMHYC
jgi:hypothetical protein